jgi:isopenicillin N synthase-like dioxygenase
MCLRSNNQHLLKPVAHCFLFCSCCQQVVPVLDLSVSQDSDLASACRDACQRFGFFQITNHGVDAVLIRQHADLQKRFFAMPKEKKEQILVNSLNRGYTPVNEETLDPAHSTTGDAHEGLYFGREVSADSPDAALPLHGPNQWPDEGLLPEYRTTVEAYMKAMTDLGHRLLRLLALSLDLPEDYFAQFFHRPMTFLRPLHYVSAKSDEAAGKFAAGAHTDYGCLTILWTDGTPGLQIYLQDQWKNIDPIPGGFIINLGDMLHRWTGGLYPSTLHRVINPLGVERWSNVFFFEPDPLAVVEVVPSCKKYCAEKGWESRYPPIRFWDHLREKYEQTHSGYRQAHAETHAVQ